MPMNEISTHYLNYSEISVSKIDLIEELYFHPGEIERVKRLLMHIISEPAIDSVNKILKKI